MNRAFVLSACVLSACGTASGQDAGYESFEDGVPAYFVATRPESLSISPCTPSRARTRCDGIGGKGKNW